jgi:hypothetical protein
MTENKNRFIDSGAGIVWLKQVPEAAPHEKPDTQGTITEHSEEK